MIPKPTEAAAVTMMVVVVVVVVVVTCGDDADDATRMMMLTPAMVMGMTEPHQNCFQHSKGVGGEAKLKNSCGWRFQPPQYLAKARGTSASRSFRDDFTNQNVGLKQGCHPVLVSGAQ